MIVNDLVLSWMVTLVITIKMTLTKIHVLRKSNEYKTKKMSVALGRTMVGSRSSIDTMLPTAARYASYSPAKPPVAVRSKRGSACLSAMCGLSVGDIRTEVSG